MDARRWPSFPVEWGMVTAVTLTLLLLAGNVYIARAHERVEVGPYALVIGWLMEPPLVGERNALTLEITEEEQPVTGAEANLDVELLFGPESYRANLNPTTTPGFYTVDIFPTVRGQYTLRLFGTLGETAVDVELEPEEVFLASRIQFPEPMPDARELDKEITGLEAEVQSVRTLAIAGVAVGTLGLLIGGLALLKSGKRD